MLAVQGWADPTTLTKLFSTYNIVRRKRGNIFLPKGLFPEMRSPLPLNFTDHNLSYLADTQLPREPGNQGFIPRLCICTLSHGVFPSNNTWYYVIVLDKGFWSIMRLPSLFNCSSSLCTNNKTTWDGSSWVSATTRPRALLHKRLTPRNEPMRPFSSMTPALRFPYDASSSWHMCLSILYLQMTKADG